MKAVLGILAHVDAGKTTFSEQLLYNAGAIKKRGRVDDKNTVMDTDEIERSRGITIFSQQAVFKHKDMTCYIADTPGHADFSAEMERFLQILDYALIIVSAVEGVQSHTRTLWQLLKKRGIPCFFFINKIDRIGADVARVFDEIQRDFGDKCLMFDKGIPYEEAAQLDEQLLEMFINDELGEEWYGYLSDMVNNRDIFPVMAGSALKNEGVTEFLDLFADLVKTNYGGSEFGGKVYKIRRDAKGARLELIKVTSGVLRVKDVVGDFGKVNEIRIYNGDKYESVPMVSAGDLCAVTGLDAAKTGDSLGECSENSKPEMIPMLVSKLLFPDDLNPMEILEKMRMLEDEDPSLNVEWREGEILVRIMGEIQLEVLSAVIEKRFGFKAGFGPCSVIYKETVKKPVIGRGHFEPLRHYAEVHLEIAPSEHGSGVSFESRCPLDVLDKNWQRLIETHVFEKKHLGVLVGGELTDVKITLLIGRAHLKHTEGGDFRQAVYRAIRQGLMKAENILLEPMYEYEVTVPNNLAGRVMSDIQRMSGMFYSPETDGCYTVICGRVPVSEFMEYPKELASFSRGEGRLSTKFGGYEKCHNTEEIIEKEGYEPERDLDNTPDSVFCSHGAGFPVKWNEADRMMHCES